MPTDITITGTATVKFKKVFRNVPDDEIEDILNMSPDNVSCNVDESDILEISELDDWEIKANKRD